MVAIAEVAGAAALAICHSVVWLSIRGHLPALRARLSTDADARAEAERSAPELTLGHVFRRSWRIGASEITWGVQWYAGLILLGVLSTSTEAAWHSAGLRLVLALHTGVWLYLYVLLPSFARLVKTDAAQWVSLTSQSIRLTGWMGCLVALVGTLAAQPILTTVFGAPYVAAVPVLRALVWVIPIAWMSGHLRYSFIAADRPEKDYHAALAGAGATVLLTIALVPIWQSAGAAVALLGGIMANAAAARVLATGVLPRVAPGRHLLPSAACCAGCLALGFLLAPLAGDIAATLVAGGLLAGTALVVERQTARALAGVFAGAKRERQSVETVS
jgi:O-antigen/teichoic acid export membrane protein